MCVCVLDLSYILYCIFYREADKMFIDTNKSKEIIPRPRVGQGPSSI